MKKKRKPIELQYDALGGFEFASLLEKIDSTPCSSNKASADVAKIVTAIKKVRENVTDEYKTDIADKYCARDKDGNVVSEEGHEGLFKVDPTKLKEFEEAQKGFGKRVATVDWQPFKLSMLNDVKLSPKEIRILGALLENDLEDLGGHELPDGLASMKKLSELRANQ